MYQKALLSGAPFLKEKEQYEIQWNLTKSKRIMEKLRFDQNAFFRRASAARLQERRFGFFPSFYGKSFDGTATSLYFRILSCASLRSAFFLWWKFFFLFLKLRSTFFSNQLDSSFEFQWRRVALHSSFVRICKMKSSIRTHVPFLIFFCFRANFENGNWIDGPHSHIGFVI